MSTHNIGFYEDLTKIIFKLSSNIIKYAPYSSAAAVFSVPLFFTSCVVHGSRFFMRNQEPS